MGKQKTQQNWWTNRIVRYGEQPANQFLAHELNARRHPAKQREALRASLDSVGWIAPCVVSAKSGKLLDGHARIEGALSIDDAMAIPFVEIEVSETEEKLILAAFDPITGLATYDREALDVLLREVSTGDARIQEMLSELATDNGLIPSVNNNVNGASQLGALQYRVVIVCDSETQQTELLERFESEGLNCQALIS